ncbi:MAG: WG repeat-containing protein [Bacteroidales bacterium]|nr:WG repeat-containing protein [Bacteroidales bacterium]
MKTKITAILLMVALSVPAFSQIPGTPYKAPAPTPQKPKKYCDECGIEMHNVTYAYQHHSWCPYYRAQYGDGPATTPHPHHHPSTKQVVAAAAVSAASEALANEIANEISRAADEYTANANKTYTNSRPGESNGKYIVGKDELSGKIGVFNNFTHDWLLKPKYREMKIYSLDAAVAKNKKDKYGLVNCYSGNEVLPFEYDDFNVYAQGKMVALGKYTGTEKKPSYAERKAHSVWGLWDTKGKQVVPMEYDSIKYSEVSYNSGPIGTVFVYKNGKVGVLDENGAMVLPINFNWTSNRLKANGTPFITAKQDSLYGLYSATNGAQIMPPVFKNVRWTPFFITIQHHKSMKWGMVDGSGNVVLPFEFDDMIYMTPSADAIKALKVPNRLCKASKNGKWGVYDHNGVMLLPHNYSGNDADLNKALMLIPRYSFAHYLRSRAEILVRTKGEFETTSEFEARQKDQNLQTKYIEAELANADKEFLAAQLRKNALDLVLSPYDADASCFTITTPNLPTNSYKLVVKRDDARTFKENFQTMKAAAASTIKCFIDNDAFAIAEMTFTMPDGNVIKYTNPDTEGYTDKIFPIETLK